MMTTRLIVDVTSGEATYPKGTPVEILLDDGEVLEVKVVDGEFPSTFMVSVEEVDR